MEANKVKALEAALSQIDRQFGKGTVMAAHHMSLFVMLKHPTQKLSKRCDVAWRYKKTCRAIFNHLWDATNTAPNHREAGCHRLNDHPWQPF